MANVVVGTMPVVNVGGRDHGHGVVASMPCLAIGALVPSACAVVVGFLQVFE